MNKYLLVALSAALFVPVSLSAQTKLEDNLKAVMVLFDKSRKESEARIEELTQANEELTAKNQGLEEQLDSTKGQLEALQKENMLLRSKISEVAVNELETAALIPTIKAPVQKKNQMTKQAKETTDSDELPIPDFTPNAFKKTGNQANQANLEPLSDGTVLLVNINTSTDRELRMLPGVGPQMAQRIIEARPFASIWDLMRLQGMGKKRIEALQVYITAE